MLMMTLQILKSVDFTKTKAYISRERNIFSSNEKIRELRIKGYFMAKKCFVVEVTFNKIVTNTILVPILSCSKSKIETLQQRNCRLGYCSTSRNMLVRFYWYQHCINVFNYFTCNTGNTNTLFIVFFIFMFQYNTQYNITTQHICKKFLSKFFLPWPVSLQTTSNMVLFDRQKLIFSSKLLWSNQFLIFFR